MIRVVTVYHHTIILLLTIFPKLYFSFPQLIYLRIGSNFLCLFCLSFYPPTLWQLPDCSPYLRVFFCFVVCNFFLDSTYKLGKLDFTWSSLQRCSLSHGEARVALGTPSGRLGNSQQLAFGRKGREGPDLYS